MWHSKWGIAWCKYFTLMESFLCWPNSVSSGKLLCLNLENLEIDGIGQMRELKSVQSKLVLEKVLHHHCCPCRTSYTFLTMLWFRDKEGKFMLRISQALINSDVKSIQVSRESKETFYCIQLKNKLEGYTWQIWKARVLGTVNSPLCAYRQDFFRHPTQCLVPYSCSHPSTHLRLLHLGQAHLPFNWSPFSPGFLAALTVDLGKSITRLQEKVGK